MGKSILELLSTTPSGIGTAAAIAIGLLVLVACRRTLRNRSAQDRKALDDHGLSTHRLRFVGSETQEPVEEQLLGPVSGANGKTVLIADDDPAVTKSLSIRLEALGLTTIRSPDAMHALHGAHRFSPDLIIVDMDMPSGSGLAICEMLSADPQRAGTPAIIYTGSTDEQMIARCRQLGAHYVLKSPDGWQELKPLICDLLDIQPEQASGDPNSPDRTATAAHPKMPPQPAGVAEATQLIPTERKDLKILCIDADQKATKSLQLQLRCHGINLIAATDVEHAYLECFSIRPDAILLDSTLPGTEWRAALTRLRQHPLAGKAPTIVIGELGDSAAAHETTTIDGVKCLPKPINADQLLAELSSFAGLSDIFTPRTTGGPDTGPSTPAPINEILETWTTGPTDCTTTQATATQTSSGSTATMEEVATSDHGQLEEPAVRHNRPKVLCIDDDPNVSRSILIHMQPYEVDVIRAFNGMQGYWMGLDSRPDVIITDLKMPEGEGNYIFARFQSHPLTKDVPVIVLTGETNPAMKRRMLSQGASAYFTKPWNSHELLHELERHIDLRPATAHTCAADS